MLTSDDLVGAQRTGTVVSVFRRDQIPPPFAFVLNVSELANDSSVEIAPGYIIRRANAAQIKFIKRTLGGLFGKYFGGELWQTRIPESGEGKLVRLPPKSWRYFVIDVDNNFEHFDALDKALIISDLGIEIGLTVLRADFAGTVLPVCVCHPPRLFQSLAILSDFYSDDNFVKPLSKSDGLAIGVLFSKLDSHEHAVLDLHKPISLLRELKDLPPFSPLQVLGYFAILESLLTHPPSPGDRYDSITRQIINKLALLDDRWERKLDYSSFGSVPHNKIWTKMYAYRSAIAHGRLPDFKVDLSLLKSDRNANILIREAVTRTIRQALVEPQLVADLHNC
jgi:hypothetical protein